MRAPDRRRRGKYALGVMPGADRMRGHGGCAGADACAAVDARARVRAVDARGAAGVRWRTCSGMDSPCSFQILHSLCSPPRCTDRSIIRGITPNTEKAIPARIRKSAIYVITSYRRYSRAALPSSESNPKGNC